MSAFKAWGSLLGCGSIGTAALMGYDLPRDPRCSGRCTMESLARMQDQLGDGTMALLMFTLGILGFMFYALRSR